MKRPGLVRTVVVVQFLIGAILLGASLAMLYDVFFYPTEGGPFSGAGVVDVMIKRTATIGVAMGLLVLLGALALRTNKCLGWWFTLISDLVIMSLLIYSLVTERDMDWKSKSENAAIWISPFLIVSVLLLLPPVRRFYWRTMTPAP